MRSYFLKFLSDDTLNDAFMQKLRIYDSGLICLFATEVHKWAVMILGKSAQSEKVMLKLVTKVEKQ